ncbi:MAG TPA: hypothetical protein ENJ31_02585, partial [Anaerolineae bacterium]|nr:hypothetical protein [Anaerolineae bacterium]
MNTQKTTGKQIFWLVLSIAIAGVALALSGSLARMARAADPPATGRPDWTPAAAAPRPLAPLTAPDLIIESIEYAPANPGIGESVDITITIKNQGDAAAGTGFYTYLYIDPATEPPDDSTPDTSYTYIFDLAPGATYRWTYLGYTFSTEGQHPVWAWVDKTDAVAENDETNNLSHVSIPVGQVGDGYEPDDACAEAQSIPTDGTVQHHDLNPVGDVDWVQFEAVSGVRYVIEAVHIGADANVIMELHNACGGPPGFGGGQRIEFVAPTSGTYYVKVQHHDDAYGPQNAYDLSVTAQGDPCTGDHEPNNACTASGDIPTDGTVQHHSFCRAGDEDWVRFQGVAGTTYVIEAFNPGPDADVILELHSSCSGPPGFGGGQRIEWTCPADGDYYLKAYNHDPDQYGANATYDLRIAAQSNCQPDSFEADDTAASASTLTVDGDPQTHNTCPAGDVDWARFTAAAGITYSLETLHPAAQADTYLCLYQADGSTQIACDDDSGPAKASRLIWQAPASGDYLLQVRHYRADVAGPDTQYDLAVWTGLCRRDDYEPDDDQGTARNISTDGAAQEHDICPAADADWLRFQANAGTNYVIQTSELGPEADTILALFNAAGDQLAFNDDYGDGLASRISYQIQTSGEYYVQVQHYDLTRFGSGTEYQVSVVVGTPPPTPSPTPTPTPSPPPPPPPPSEIHTLILVNRARIASVYGTPAADNLMAKLYQLAAHSSVQGEVLQIENNATVAAAYATWESDLLDTDKTNAVAAALRGVVVDYLNSHSQVEYLLLVGGDWIIPFRRVPDQTTYPESRY